MSESIMVGCDLHEKSMLLMIAVDREDPRKRSYPNTEAGRRTMIKHLRDRADKVKASRVVVAYEASCLGFGLYDELHEAGIVCHVLAPTKMLRSPHRRKNKTDEKDALAILDAVRSHELANVKLPAVWVPDHQTRADRSLVRMRLTLGEKVAKCKTQVQSQLKLYGLKKPDTVENNWTQAHHRWLSRVAQSARSPLHPSQRWTLQSLLRQIRAGVREIAKLDAHQASLAREPRDAEAARSLQTFTGVGLLTAMVFLTEMGDLSRFNNRREIGAYLGLVPSAHESGERQDRKGRITKQGPSRVRKVLCQATWSRMGSHGPTRQFFQELEERAPEKKKKQIVAHMRKLGIRLWREGLAAQRRAQAFDNPVRD
jgi:transposase